MHSLHNIRGGPVVYMFEIYKLKTYSLEYASMHSMLNNGGGRGGRRQACCPVVYLFKRYKLKLKTYSHEYASVHYMHKMGLGGALSYMFLKDIRGCPYIT